MDIIDAIKYAMKDSGTSGAELSRRLGKSRNFMGATFANNSDIGASNVAKMARAMGWRLVLKKGDVEVEITPRG